MMEQEPPTQKLALALFLQRLKQKPIILGVLLGFLLLGGYGVFFAGEPKPAKISLVYVAPDDEAGLAVGNEPPANRADVSNGAVSDGYSVPKTTNEDSSVAGNIPDTNSEPELKPEVPIKSRFALVLADTGMQRRVIEAINEDLPPQVGIALSVYSPNINDTLGMLAGRGHEVWLQIATQGRGAAPLAGIDAGPLGLSLQAIEPENKTFLSRQFSAVANPRYLRGVYVRSDADITYNNALWRAIATDIMERNLMVLEGTPALVASDLYLPSATGAPSAYLKPKAVLNGGPRLIDSLESLAQSFNGDEIQIVVIENVSAQNVKTIANWLKGLEAKGIGLVSASSFSNL